MALGIPAIALFPYTDPDKRTEDGREAFNPDNLVCRATRAIRKARLDIGVLLDVALDPYTSHGHDGLMRGRRYPQRRDACEPLVRPVAGAGRGRLRHHRAVRHDGRAHRRHPQALEADGHTDTCRSWPTRPSMPRPSTARSATRSARPARSRATSAPTRWTRPTPTRRCARSALDIAEGADMVMVKPGMPYLDIVRRVKDDVRRADLRLPGVGRIRDAEGRGRATAGSTATR